MMLQKLLLLLHDLLLVLDLVDIHLDVYAQVWGHEDIKKGLLLTITGGVTKETGSSRLRQVVPLKPKRASGLGFRV